MKRRSIPFLLVIVLLASCGGETDSTTTTTVGTASATATQPSVIPETTPSPAALRLTRDVAYAADGQLDVYAPLDPGPWPVVVVIHGFAQGKSDFVFLAEALASRGLVVFNIGVAMHPPYLTALGQVSCAVRFAEATAAEYGGDPTRVTMVGNSDGAATGIVVALAGPEFDGDCGVADGSGQVDAMVGYEGSYDWASHEYSPSHGFVALREEDPDLWQAVNPYSLLGRNPALVARLIHGDRGGDDSANFPAVEVSAEMHQALVEAGYDTKLTVVEDASHTDVARGPYAPSEAFEVIVQQVLEVAGG